MHSGQSSGSIKFDNIHYAYNNTQFLLYVTPSVATMKGCILIQIGLRNLIPSVLKLLCCILCYNPILTLTRSDGVGINL